MSVEPGPYELRPVFPNEDVVIVVSLDGVQDADPATAWTLLFEVRTPRGVAVDGAALSVEATGAAELTARIDTAGFFGGQYRWSIRRTDEGSKALNVWGTLAVISEWGE